MANQHASTPTSAPASLVGNAFVIRYYNVLHHSPHLAHRFYTEGSKASRAEAWPETAAESAATLSGIHEKIMSLDYGSTRTEIMTVDSQDSFGGSVLVMVTGALYNGGGMQRTFVQTFLLVPREKSYFVFNDMFRYLDSDEKSSQQVASEPANGNPKLNDPETGLDQGVTENSALSQHTHVLNASETVATPDANDSECIAPEAMTLQECHHELPIQTEVSDVVVSTLLARSDPIEDQAQGPAGKAPECQAVMEEPVIEDAPKKSYASILRLQKYSPASVPRVSAPITCNVHRSSSIAASQDAQSADGLPSRALSAPELMDEARTAETEGDGRSIYVKSLPLNVTVAEIEEQFNKFGQIKQGGIDLRNQRIGVCFAFVEFEEASAVRCAIEASPINMNGRQVYIEEKRTFPSRGARGWSNLGRGYQSDSRRGRGYLGNGRGMWRGSMETDKDLGRGRGAITAHRGSGSFYGPNVLSRSQNGNVFRSMRRASNQMGQNGPFTCHDPTRNGIMVAAA